MEHNLNWTPDLIVMQDWIGTQLGHPVSINYRAEQTTDDGVQHCGLIQVLDCQTGEPIEVDESILTDAINNAQPVVNERQALETQLAEAQTLEDIRTVLGNILTNLP